MNKNEINNEEKEKTILLTKEIMKTIAENGSANSKEYFKIISASISLIISCIIKTFDIKRIDEYINDILNRAKHNCKNVNFSNLYYKNGNEIKKEDLN